MRDVIHDAGNVESWISGIEKSSTCFKKGSSKSPNFMYAEDMADTKGETIEVKA